MPEPKKIPTLEERWAEEGEGLHVIDEDEEAQLFDNDDDLELDDEEDDD